MKIGTGQFVTSFFSEEDEQGYKRITVDCDEEGKGGITGPWMSTWRRALATALVLFAERTLECDTRLEPRSEGKDE